MGNPRKRSSVAVLAVIGLAAAGCTESDADVTVESRSGAGSGTAITESTRAIPFDDDVRTGTLDNGLTYYIRHSDRPGKKAELRLTSWR